MSSRFAEPATDRAARRASCDVRVWLLRTSAWRARWPDLQRHVDAAANARLRAIRNPARRQDRLLAGALHRVVLAEALQVAPDLLPLYRSGSGQPRLAIPGLHTSLSHADDVVAIALGHGGPVGVDVEMRNEPSLQPIADLVCAPGETAADDAALLALWVRKEAALKAAGLGLARAMTSFHAPEGGQVCLDDAQGESLALDVCMLDGTGDCVVAVAAPAGSALRWQWLHPRI